MYLVMINGRPLSKIGFDPIAGLDLKISRSDPLVVARFAGEHIVACIIACDPELGRQTNLVPYDPES